MAVSVDSQIKRIMNRTAMGILNSIEVFDPSSPAKRFWALVDAAEDETFENRLKGQTITDLDDILFDGCATNVAKFGELFRLLHSYFTVDLGLTGTTPFQSYLTDKGIRISKHVNDALTAILGAGYTLGNQFVFPYGQRVNDTVAPVTSGMDLIGVLDVSENTFSNPVVNPSGWYAILATRVSGAAATVGNLLCINQNTTPVNKTVAMTYNMDANDQTIVGKLGINSQSTVTLGMAATATAIFSIGDYAMIYKDAVPGTEDVEDSIREIVLIDNIITSTVTLHATPKCNGLIASGAYLVPLFTGVASASGGSGTGVVNLYAMPDWKIEL